MTITLDVNEIFEIRKESVPTAGYVWKLETRDAFKIISDTFQPYNLKAVGGAGVQIFKVQALSKGSFKLNIFYSRPWSDEISKSEIIDVEVV